ncbi:MAG: hypothetical protein WAS36_02260 [Candidatus Saccharimonadales bacterium]
MNALLLPGNSSRHGEWVEILKSAVAANFQYTKTQHYLHWQTGGDKADIDYEISVAQTEVEQLEPYIIIAKSIGTAISVKGVADGKLKPKKLILLGVPINGGVSKNVFSDWLQQINVTVAFVQNTNDPYGSFSSVKEAFEGKGHNITFIELPGETHDYLDFEAIVKLI